MNKMEFKDIIGQHDMVLKIPEPIEYIDYVKMLKDLETKLDNHILATDEVVSKRITELTMMLKSIDETTTVWRHYMGESHRITQEACIKNAKEINKLIMVIILLAITCTVTSFL